MTAEDDVRLAHLVDAAESAVRHSQGRHRSDLGDDELLRLALTKLVEIVGEAAKHVGPEVRARYPDVPWRAAARTRDRLVHHYFDINLDVLWETVSVDLPAILAALRPTDGGRA